MKLAERMKLIKPSATLGMAAEAAALRAQGRDIVDLSAGEPDFDTPEHIKAAARDALARGLTKYTPVGGLEVLKDAIIEKLKRENGLVYGRTEVMASCGGKHALFNAMLALFEAGDEVILPAPYWVSYPEMLALAGAVTKVVETSPGRGFRMSPAEFEAAIGARTRAVLINSPSNPTGAVYDAEELRAIGEIAHRRGLLVVTDDIYENLTSKRIPHIGALVPALRPQLLIINAVSKSYAMTGWRIGYAAAPADPIKAMTTLQSQSTSSPTSIAQAAAAAALTGPQECVVEMAREFALRRDLVVRLLQAIPGVVTTVPEGAFYVFPDVSAHFGKQGPDGPIRGAHDLAMYLLRHTGVATVPGEGFGAPRHIRISYATSRAALEDGIARIARALANLR